MESGKKKIKDKGKDECSRKLVSWQEVQLAVCSGQFAGRTLRADVRQGLKARTDIRCQMSDVRCQEKQKTKIQIRW